MMSVSKSKNYFSTIYPWMDTDFFEKIIQPVSNNKNIVITNINLNEAVARGEHYGSEMIRATITYKCNDQEISNTINLIIKTYLKETADVSTDLNMLAKEILTYKRVLPRVHELLINNNRNTKISARCYVSCENPSYMIFEDLKQTGYQNVNRKNGLNIECFKVVLSKVAKWHATTAVLMQKDKSIFKDHMEPSITDTDGFLTKLLTYNLLAIVDVLQNWPNYEIISEKLLQTIKNVRKKCANEYVINDKEFNVLGHGDLWCNNVMFKKSTNDGVVEDAILVDYSIGFWGSPGIDLSYLLFTSSDINVQEKEWDLLIMQYHNELITLLDELNYASKYPTLTDIHVAIMKHGFYAALMALFVIGIRNLQNSDIIGISIFVCDTIEAHKFRVQFLNNPECKPYLEYLLNYFHRKGYFD